MDILRAETGQGGTVVYFTNDDGELHAHAIPHGILEQRKEAWQLPDDIDPIDVVLVESHYAADEMPEFLFDDPDYPASREKVLDLVRQHRGNIHGKRLEAQAACALPHEEAVKLRNRLRSQYDDFMAAAAPPPTSSFEASQRMNSGLKSVRLGYERLAEERLAEEIISANPELKRAPRVQNDETVGLTVKFV